MLERESLAKILEPFGLSFSKVTQFYDATRGSADQRFHYILDNRYVLKINTEGNLTESRLGRSAG